MKNDGRVSASEIGEYVYCKRAWYLRSRGLLETTDIMREGTKQHMALFQRTGRLTHGRFIAILLILLGLLLLILSYALQYLL